MKSAMTAIATSLSLFAFDVAAQTAPPPAAGGGDSSAFSLIFVLAFLLIGGIKVYQFLRVQMLKRENYDWYKAQYPALVANGHVKCHKCESSNVSTERMMKRTYLRAHVCRQCGTSLYYSVES